MASSSSLAEVINMADRIHSPKLEDGYTKLANELLDAIIISPFSQHQLRVLLAIMRKTYGFNKKTDDIGLSQLVTMTGIDKADVSRAVSSLTTANVVIRSAGQFGHKLSINKHYGQWRLVKSQPRKTVGECPTKTVGECPTKTVGECPTTKDNLPKDNLPKEKNLLRNRDCASSSFDAFWSIWLNKRDKKRARKAFDKIAPDAALLETMLAAVKAQNASAEWIEDGGKYIPHATTWLNGERWNDEIKPIDGSFSAEQQAFVDTFNANIGARALPVSEWSQQAADLITMALSGKWGTDWEKWAGFWRFVRDECQFKGQVSFEWLMNRDNIVKIRRGEFQPEGQQ